MQTTAAFNPVCALCGKKFETCSFLFKHIARKHAPISVLSSETPLLKGGASSGPPSEAPLLKCAASSVPPSEVPLLLSASAASSVPPSEAPLLRDTKRKIKREAGNARKKRRRGGFTNKGRIAYRKENGPESLMTGNNRSCLPDATWNAAPDTLQLHGVTYEGLKACMPDEGDTTTASIDTHLRQFGLVLAPVSSQFLAVKGGAELALLQRGSGAFVVQLRITTDNSDKKPDLHFVSFDGRFVKDNARTAKVKEIEPADRTTPAAARAVFNSLFPGLKVVISAVYQLPSTTLI